MKRKIISILFALVLVLSFSLVMAVPAAARLSEVWVDDNALSDPGPGDPTVSDPLEDGSVEHPFDIIQEGVDTVAPGGTVNVADGNYNATTDNSILLEGDLGYCFIHIDESITLVGQSRDGVILDGTGLQGEVRSTGIWVSASDVMVKNLTIQNFTQTPEIIAACYGLYVIEKFRDYTWENVAPLQYVTAENLRVVGSVCPIYFMKTEYATVKDCVVDNNFGDGIWVAWGSHHATVQGNIVTNSADHGIWVGSSWMGEGHSSNAPTIIDNIINGAREGGISFVNSGGAIISDNTITNVAGEGWSVGALSLKDSCSNVTAFNNNIYDNDGAWGEYSGTGHGIGIDGTPENINLFLNNIYDNSGDGCHNYSTVDVNAKHNWWGDLSGPGGQGLGSGDEVSTYVDFAPWLSGGPGAYAWIDTDLDSAFDLDESHFATIQAAIGSAISGDTISVTAGTYNEGLIDIDKSITISGDPSDKPVISPTVDTINLGHRGWFQVTGTTVVDFKNLEFDGSGQNIENAIRYQEGPTGTVENCDFSNMSLSTYVGFAIVYVDYAAMGVGPALDLDPDGYIKGCTFTNIQRVSVSVFGVDKVYLQNNIFTGKGDGDWLDYGIEVGGGGVAVIEQNNTITNCTGVALSDGSTSAGILVTTYFGDGTQATITGNTLTGNSGGIAVGYDESDTSVVVAHYNNISGNADYGVDSTAPAVDATYNWWGHETGPEHATLNPGAQGDAVSDDVLFSPWLYKTKAIVDTKEPAYAQSVVLDNYGDYGWNTFSAPIYLDDTADTWAKLITLTSLNYDIAYRFDLATQKFVNLETGDGYEITPGEGFFIKMKSAGSLPILYSTADNLILPSRLLTVGFNLIGLANLEDMEASVALFSLAGEGQVVSSTGNVEPGAVLAGDTVYVGEGYWVYMLGEETLVGYTMTPVNWVP